MRQNLRKLNIRLLALAMAAMLLLCSVPAVSAAEASGSCGDKLEWSFSGDTLTITGSGDMYDYPESTMAPWYDYRRSISTVHLPDGLTRIGDLAFYDCMSLKIVSMPDSVEEVGWYAFSGCTSMTMLDLSSNLKTIDDGGFRECTALPSVRLPDSLTDIGSQGFYRCESLSEITIPASVKSIGFGAFAYCSNLIRANIKAEIRKLPDWMFYGCARLTDVILSESIKNIGQSALDDCPDLTNVVQPGAKEDREQIAEDIERDQDNPAQSPNVSDKEEEKPSTNVIVDVDEDEGTVNNTTTTTTQTDNASVSSSIVVTYSVDGTNKTVAKVTVTLENAKAWGEVADKVSEAVDSAEETFVEIYIKDNSTLDKGAFADFVGKPVMVTLHNMSGAVWKIDLRTVEEEQAEDTYDLSYERIDATQKQLEMLGCSVGYQIRFAANAQINTEVLIKLPIEHARRNASLYHIKLNGEPELLQTVVVDNSGYAHFYLASVERRTVYLIGINVPVKEAMENAIIPEVLHQDFGVTDNLEEVEYVISGRTSSWGMNIRQVTFIMIGVMFTTVCIVGFVMYTLNKRKLKMGYIPDLDEEFE